MSKLNIQTAGRRLNCGRCLNCGEGGSSVDKLGNGMCHCKSCGNAWTPIGANYTLEQSR